MMLRIQGEGSLVARTPAVTQLLLTGDTRANLRGKVIFRPRTTTLLPHAPWTTSR